MSWEDRFRLRASAQEGLVAKFQLADMGCTPSEWNHAKTNGRWRVLSPRVVALDGTPTSDAQRVLAAVFDASPGAVLHGPTALAWMGLPPYDLQRLIVARPRDLNGAPVALAELHRLRALRARDVIVVRGVPSESALRAIWVEAARYASPARADIGAVRIGALLDTAHRRGLVTWAGLNDAVDDLHERGRSGTTIMRTLTETRPPGSSPTESRQEDQLETLLGRAGARPLRRQPNVGGSQPIGRTDHRDDLLPLVVETNSLTFHTTPTDQAADELRYQRLTEAGFTVGVVWENDLWSRPDLAVETVERARRHAAQRSAIVVHSPGCPWIAARFGSSAAIEVAHAWNLSLAA